MATNLHVMNPGEPYVAGGTETPIDLYCLDPNNQDKKVLVDVKQVIVHITNTVPTLVFDEVGDWGPDRMVLTKIVNPCTTEINYVTEYYVDVQRAAECCLAEVPTHDPSGDVVTPREWKFGSSVTDPYNDLNSGSDTIVYPKTGNSAPGAFSVEVDTTSFEEDLFLVLREDKDQPDRKHYFNSDVIYGSIPDQIWRASFVNGNYKYTITRVAATLDQNYNTKFTS